MKELSGFDWTTRYFDSRKTEDLDPVFRPKAEAFISALRNAGISVDVLMTRRSAERAYLMHYAFELARGVIHKGDVAPDPDGRPTKAPTAAPENIPAMTGVDINWVHPTVAESIVAAAVMNKAFGTLYAPALDGDHVKGMAMDLHIGVQVSVPAIDATKTIRRIPVKLAAAVSPEVAQLALTFGVKQDPVHRHHWSMVV